MLFVSITGQNAQEILAQLSKIDPRVGGVEIRLDTLSSFTMQEATSFLKSSPFPVVFTLRAPPHKANERQRQALLKQLYALNPPFLDLEYDIELGTLPSSSTQLIYSYHNFDETPENLEQILADMEKRGAGFYKIATCAHSLLDALRMLAFVQKHAELGKKICGICMGEEGQITRILGPLVGNHFSYGALSEEKSVAPGQLSIGSLFDIYRTHTLNAHTQVYALLGDPIVNSVSHITHNHFFDEQGHNAIYVKMKLKKEELADFFSLVRKLPFFKGFSVTMPLKEAIIPYLVALDSDAKAIGAVNTLVLDQTGFKGFNTDGIGALNALEKQVRVQNKKVILLGAGGTAKAIAFEATKRGAQVIVLNRTIGKAEQIAQKMGVLAGNLNEMPRYVASGYDILINATPVGMEPDAGNVPIDVETILPGATVMDVVVNPKKTRLLQEAEKKGCKIVTGVEMFWAQAELQFKLWGLETGAELNFTGGL